jgi:predicted acetyltransferase
MAALAATCFGNHRPVEVTAMWRTMIPADGALIACDDPDIVGMAFFLDLQLTVPGGTALPAAGLSWVAVAPTHRRRGLLRHMFTELHNRLHGRYPIAALLASEGGIYGRFGYGPATIERTLRVDRRFATMHPGIPADDAVRVVELARHRNTLQDIYERWRRHTPGGMYTPPVMWEELFTDRESSRGGGSALFCLLHPQGFALYRVHGGESNNVQVTSLVALTDQARCALWRTLLGLDLMESVAIKTFPGDPLPYLVTNPRLVQTTSVEDGLWLRILDVAAALEARSYCADVTAVLDISDPELGGGGRFTLDVRDGRARCTPADADPDIAMDLDVLGSMYLGVHSASGYAAAHRLRCKDSVLIRQLDAAFATDVPAEPGFSF